VLHAWLQFQDFNYLGRSVVGRRPLMHKDNYLFTHVQHATQVLKDDIIHDVVSALGIAHFFDAVERAFQRARSVTRIESKSALLVGANEFGDVQVVGESGRKAD